MFPWLVLGMGFVSFDDTNGRLAGCLPICQARNWIFDAILK
jgi:hypothetical protein